MDSRAVYARREGENWIENLKHEQQELNYNVEVSFDEFLFSNVSTML